MPATPSIDHDAVARAIEAFACFADATGGAEAKTRVQPFETRYRSGRYRLVLVGEEKKGKSSLVSALLDAPNLLPSGPEPMTACVFKIVYGEQLRYRVFFLPDDPDQPDTSRPAPADVAAEEVAQYGTESLNPANCKRVDFIAVEHPHPLLAAGLCIVDLPGLGGLKREHGLLTLSYLPNADAALFVTDSVQTILSREEIATLERLRKFTEQVIFVQTKIDAVSETAWQSWRDRNLEEIEKRLGQRRAAIPYFAVSSTLKRDYDGNGDPQDLADSGFAELAGFIADDLLLRKQDLLALPLLTVIAQETGAAAQPIENELAIVTTKSEEALERLEKELRTSSQNYEEWRREMLPQIQSRFRARYRDAETEARRKIANALDPSPNGAIVSQLVNEISVRQLTAAQIEEEAAAMNDAAVALCADALDQIGTEFENSVSDAFQAAAGEIGAATGSILIERASMGDTAIGIVATQGASSSAWQTLMQGRMGFMFGSMASGMVASLIFPPLGLAALAATFLGGLFGARRSIMDAQRRERDMARNQLRALLCDTVRRMGSRAVFEFGVAAERNHAAMLDALMATVRKREKDEGEAMEAVRAQRHQTREQSAARARDLREKLGLAQAVLGAIRAADQAVPNAAAATQAA